MLFNYINVIHSLFVDFCLKCLCFYKFNNNRLNKISSCCWINLFSNNCTYYNNITYKYYNIMQHNTYIYNKAVCTQLNSSIEFRIVLIVILKYIFHIHIYIITIAVINNNNNINNFILTITKCNLAKFIRIRATQV